MFIGPKPIVQTSHLDVRKAAEDVDVLVGDDDTRPRGVLNGKARLAVLASDTPNGAAQVVPVQQLDVRDHEGVDEEVLEPEQRHGVLQLEAHHEGRQEVRALLHRPHVARVLRRLELCNTHREMNATSADNPDDASHNVRGRYTDNGLHHAPMHLFLAL